MYTVPEVAQKGVVLVFAMLVLLLLSLLVTAVMRGSMHQLRMARNLESAVIERQRALGEIERILEHQGLRAPEGERGALHCSTNDAGEDCDFHSLPATGPVATEDRTYLRVANPDGLPPRLVEAGASSALAYRAVHYEIAATSGRTSLVQGVRVLVPRPQP